MEYSKVTALDEEEKVTDKRPSVSYHYLYPCDFLEEALRALFKCFGLDNNSQAYEEQEPEKTTRANPETSTPNSTPELQVADPSDPKEAADPPSSTSVTTEIAAASTRAVSPPIGSGRGPQIN
ncbi:uncharacterized protein LOC112172399 [Rosa chinensis]|uniref:uncharacterized protein LOC112172399 n=1 Tax=Rosa chinensis TaxID=74649 RepID=UPI000D090800|nr:uncharacterized protein LOC112172399 [Rosa chinensis]